MTECVTYIRLKYRMFPKRHLALLGNYFFLGSNKALFQKVNNSKVFLKKFAKELAYLFHWTMSGTQQGQELRSESLRTQGTFRLSMPIWLNYVLSDCATPSSISTSHPTRQRASVSNLSHFDRMGYPSTLSPLFLVNRHPLDVPQSTGHRQRS